MSQLRRILIVDQNYPSETNHFADGFVHTRVKAYAERCKVVVASIPNDGPDFRYEGIEVRAFADTAALRDFIARFEPDLIGVHFAKDDLIDDLLLTTRVPFVVWVHGYEAIGFQRNLFGVRSARGLASHAVTASFRLLRFRRLLRHCQRSGRGAFVLPSQWLLRTVQIDTLTHIPRAHVIPNPIDDALFRYAPKAAELRTRVMLLRSFTTRKYATDIAVDAIVQLARHPEFERFQFDLYGQGVLFAAAQVRLRCYPNVSMHERFFSQRELPALHASYGVLLCPTRQDTHGVTMCEGMSSGLVPIASNNTAIPEFVTDYESGLLTRSSRQIAARLLELQRDPALFAQLSAGAAAAVRCSCGALGVIEREFEVFERTVHSAA